MDKSFYIAIMLALSGCGMGNYQDRSFQTGYKSRDRLILIGRVSDISFQQVHDSHGVQLLWPVYKFDIELVPFGYGTNLKRANGHTVNFFAVSDLQHEDGESGKEKFLLNGRCPGSPVSKERSIVIINRSDQLRQLGTKYELEACAYINSSIPVGFVKY